MTSMTASNVLPCRPLLAPAATICPHVPSERSVSGALHGTVHLDCGNVLRIHGGRGLRLTPVSGVLWITEEGSLDDTVLLPGRTHRIEGTGLALVLAHRPARVDLEVPAGTWAPRRVDLAMADGEPGRRVPFGAGDPFSLHAIAAAIRTAIRRAIATASGGVASRKRFAPTSGESAHHEVFSSRRAPRARHGNSPRSWDDPVWQARDAVLSHSLFPFY